MRMFACGLAAVVASVCCMVGEGGVAPSEAYAREEFARYVTRMTGRDYDGPLEIVLDGALGKEEFAVTKRDGRLSIRGGVRGVLYGVYDVLEKFGGKRLTERTQLCLTNPEVFDLVVRRLREAIAENPEANMYALAHNDYKNWCECAKCKAINDAADNPGMTEFLFVDKVEVSVFGQPPCEWEAK